MWRAGYALRQRSGLLRRRFEATPLDAIGLADVLRRGQPHSADEYFAMRDQHPRPFFFPAGKLPGMTNLKKVMGQPGKRRTLEIADGFCKGDFLYFSRHVHSLGWPVNWLSNPMLPSEHENQTHWCDYPTFSPTLGDIKDVWEPSRFACAYWLARAYAVTKDERYPAVFWELFDSWRRQNPPNRGPNWKCGQETAIRLFAWCFALHAFWGCPATTPPRVANMVKMIALQADRIAGNIGFAISQKNNHSISEAVGLLTVGLLFPELRGAKRWRVQGLDIFQREVRRQVYRDGSFVQHSMNYHRVMLHDCLWALRLAWINGEPVDDDVEALVHRAGRFLHEMMDVETGRVPNYGANDGALVLPLTSVDYLDFRPTVQAAHFLANQRPCLPRGPWDEAVVWLFGDSALASEREETAPSSSRFDDGGYYTIRRERAWGMVRCHAYRDRPAHVDMLHVDLWRDGTNVLSDSGSYKYFPAGEEELGEYFPDIAAHNTIQIGDTGPLSRITRFLWMPWPASRCLDHAVDRFSGESLAYDRPPWNARHRRTVAVLANGEWEITDEVLGQGHQRVALRWHLEDAPYELDAVKRVVELALPRGAMSLSIEGSDAFIMTIHRGLQSPSKVSGWTSLYYGERAPRPTIELTGEASLPVRLVTRVRFERGKKG